MKKSFTEVPFAIVSMTAFAASPSATYVLLGGTSSLAVVLNNDVCAVVEHGAMVTSIAAHPPPPRGDAALLFAAADTAGAVTTYSYTHGVGIALARRVTVGNGDAAVLGIAATFRKHGTPVWVLHTEYDVYTLEGSGLVKVAVSPCGPIARVLPTPQWSAAVVTFDGAILNDVLTLGSAWGGPATMSIVDAAVWVDRATGTDWAVVLLTQSSLCVWCPRANAVLESHDLNNNDTRRSVCVSARPGAMAVVRGNDVLVYTTAGLASPVSTWRAPGSPTVVAVMQQFDAHRPPGVLYGIGRGIYVA